MSDRRLRWRNVTAVGVTHLLALFSIVYLAAIHFSWWTLALGALWYICCGLSITGGYHRLFSHGAYKASAPVRLFYLLFGAASIQGSALTWSAEHRTHHAYTDKPKDPYSVTDGFWWAHIGWILCKKDATQLDNVRDLQADALVRFQHDHYKTVATTMGLVVPFALGLLWNDPWGAVLLAGFFRVVLQWHMTFSVNSLAHTLGTKPYQENSTARDSWIVALLTFGEGYHNFHHRFQADYRNGVRWYAFDPTKWWVWSLSRVGMTRNLRRVPREKIDAARNAVRESMVKLREPDSQPAAS